MPPTTTEFPIPRSQLPRIRLTDAEYRQRKAHMATLLEQLVQEFDEFSAVNHREVNPRRWKQVATREHLRLFKERAKYRGSGRPARPRTLSADTMFPQECDEVSSVTSSTATDDFQAAAQGRRWRRRGSSGSEADATMMLMVGECPGRLEDAMHAVVVESQEDLALVDIYLHEDVADCAILETLEGPTPHEPFHYLGLKWFVKPSPATSRLVKHRDSVYLESSGLTQSASGEILGYHIMDSVDLPEFPPFAERNCVRTTQSIRTLYRQQSDNVVEVFLMGSVGLAGTIASIAPLAAAFTVDIFFGMPRAIDCGEARRLTKLVREQRQARRHQRGEWLKRGSSCFLCRSEKKLFKAVSLVNCMLCGDVVCSCCRLHKRIFNTDGVLGKFEKINCCKTCIFAYQNLPVIDQMRIPPREAKLLTRQLSLDTLGELRRASLCGTSHDLVATRLSAASTLPSSESTSAGSSARLRDSISAGSWGSAFSVSPSIVELDEDASPQRFAMLSSSERELALIPQVAPTTQQPRRRAVTVAPEGSRHHQQQQQQQQHRLHPVTTRESTMSCGASRNILTQSQMTAVRRMRKLTEVADATYQTTRHNERLLVQLQDRDEHRHLRHMPQPPLATTAMTTAMIPRRPNHHRTATCGQFV